MDCSTGTRTASFLCLFLVCDLAHGYESDIHLDATFAIARAAGWTADEASVIAAADQALDENQSTVAALELDHAANLAGGYYTLGPAHQAAKNIRLHGFSTSADAAKVVSANVKTREAALIASTRMGAAVNLQERARRLIAIGVALHFIQDEYSHHGYGGSCGAYPGNCWGHSLDSAKDWIKNIGKVREVLEPDNPGIKRWGLLPALQATAKLLAKVRQDNGDLARPLSDATLTELAQRLSTRAAGMDQVERLICNRELLGRWLRKQFTGAELANNEVAQYKAHAAACNYDDSTVANVVDIVPLRTGALTPRLKQDATATAIDGGGTYAKVLDATGFDLSMPKVEVAQASIPGTNESEFTVRVQVAGAGQLAATAVLMISLLRAEEALGLRYEFALSGDPKKMLDKTFKFKGKTTKDFVVEARLMPPTKLVDTWADYVFRNDTVTCVFSAEATPGTTASAGDLGAPTWSVSKSCGGNDPTPPAQIQPPGPPSLIVQ